jgi:hypothetical protein
VLGDGDGYSLCAGDCDDDDDTVVECTTLHLTDASFPRLQRLADFEAFGATASGRVVLVQGRLDGSVSPVAQCGIDLPLGDAEVVDELTAELDGTAVLTTRMPRNADVHGYIAVDVDACEVSNLVVQQVY